MGDQALKNGAPGREPRPAGRSRPAGALPPRAVKGLGERLRAYYADILSEPVPDRFGQLLGRLDETPPAARDEGA